MGTDIKTKEVGGGPAIGLAEDFIKLLSGTFGGQPSPGDRFSTANPVGSTGGIAEILSNILSPGAGNIGGAYSEMISRENDRNVAAIRSRFGASGGTSFGTPAAYAESQYRAEAAPRTALGIGQLQLQTLLPILQLAAGLSSRGIPQAQELAYGKQSGLGSIISTAGSIIPGAAKLIDILQDGGSGGGIPENPVDEAALRDYLGQPGNLPLIPSFTF